MDWTAVAANIQAELYASYEKDVERKPVLGDILNCRT